MDKGLTRPQVMQMAFRFSRYTGTNFQRPGVQEGFAAVRNLFNEWYPRDTSKKVRISLHQRGTSVLSHSLSV